MFLSVKIKRIYKIFALIVPICLICLLLVKNQPYIQADSKNVEDGVQLPIIMYHSILKDSARHGEYVISPDELESDLKYIKENGFTTVTTEELITYTNGGAELPEKPIMLTFDDGYYNNYLYLFPLLKKYNCKAIIGVIGTYSQQYTETPDTNAYYAHCTWENLNEMLDSGLVEVANHSYDLHKNGERLGSKRTKQENNESYKKLLTEDVMKLQDMFKTKLSVNASTFVYPFGAYDKDQDEIIRSLGFKCTLTCTEKMNYISRNPNCLYELGRYIRPSGKSLKKILETNLSKEN